ncbi:hypothetical protein PCE1_004525 [Barthelona sp. PCE]
MVVQVFPVLIQTTSKKVKSICLLKTFRNAGISIEKNPINRWNNKVDCEVIEPSDAELKSNPMICEDFLMGYENRKLQVLKELGQDRKYMGLRVNDKIRNEAGVEIEDSDRLKEMYDRYKKFSYIHCNIPIITMASIIQKEHVELKFFAYVQSLINVELWKIFLENDDNKLDNVRWQATEDFFRVFTMCFRPDELKEEFKLGEDLWECSKIYRIIMERFILIQRIACSARYSVLNVYCEISQMLVVLTFLKERFANNSFVLRYTNALEMYVVRYLSEKFIQAQALVAFLMCDLDSVKLSGFDFGDTATANYLSQLSIKYVDKDLTTETLNGLKVTMCYHFLRSRLNPDKQKPNTTTGCFDTSHFTNWSQYALSYVYYAENRGEKVRGLVGYIACVLQDSKHFAYSPNDPIMPPEEPLQLDLEPNNRQQYDNASEYYKSPESQRRKARIAAASSANVMELPRQLQRTSSEPQSARTVDDALDYLNNDSVRKFFDGEEGSSKFVNSEMIRIALVRGYTALPSYLQSSFKNFLTPFKFYSPSNNAVESAFSRLKNNISSN